MFLRLPDATQRKPHALVRVVHSQTVVVVVHVVCIVATEFISRPNVAVSFHIDNRTAVSGSGKSPSHLHIFSGRSIGQCPNVI
jgi:hypothetical protein